jgi:hypothetical protein
MAATIFDAPATTSIMTNVELIIIQSVSAFVVLLSFVITASMLLLTLIESYLVVGGGVILLGLGASRFTAPAAEGYFGYVIRVGIRLLFFYLVLAIGVQMANQWSEALVAACKPVATTLPWWTTYGVPPASIVTTACSGTLPVSAMLIYTAFAIVFMIVSIAVPYMAAGIASGTIGLALSHAFEAAFIAQTVIRPITSALQTGFKMAGRLGRVASDGDDGDTWLNTVDPARTTRRLINTDPKANKRVPAPDRNATSVIPSRARKTTLIDSTTGGLRNGKTTRVSDDRMTKRL